MRYNTILILQFSVLFQEKTNALVETIRLFEKGLSSFEGADRVALEKHLIKTLWWQFNNYVYTYHKMQFFKRLYKFLL